MSLRLRRGRREAPELNITAFMNLMVVLVPFLLITAVFSRITILELNLPTSSEGNNKQEKPTLALEVIVRKQELIISDRNSGPLKRVAVNNGKYELKEITDYLHKVKQRFPDKQDITLLLEPDVPYDLLVQIMDAVRVSTEKGTVTGELFPQISIGDAPGGGRS